VCIFVEGHFQWIGSIQRMLKKLELYINVFNICSMIGTAFSVLIRLELSAPGVQF